MKRRNFIGLLGISLAAAHSAFAAITGIGYPAIRKLLKGRKLFLVPFSHTDWAWVNSRAWMVDRHAQVLTDALDLLNTKPGFRFYLETWNEQMETFLARRPDRIEEMRKALNEGKIEVCGATTNQHPGWMETESLVRDLVIGRRLFRQFAPLANLDVIVKPDVTPGSSQMPQILSKAGYNYYGVNRPDQALTKQGVPRQFIWKGLDGSQIIVAREGGCGFIADDSFMDNFTSNWKAAVERFYEREIIKHVDTEQGDTIWLPIGCDDSRPLRHWRSVDKNGKFEEAMMPVSEFIQEWNKREASTLLFGTPLDVFKEIEKQRASLPVYEGVIDPTMWTYWYGLNGNEGLRLWRTKTDQALVSAEKFWSCVKAAIGGPYPEEDLANLWRDLLRAYSHAQMWLFANDYNAALNIVKSTLAKALELRDMALNKLVGGMRIDENRQAVVLFNDLPWERTEVVEVWAQIQHPEATNIKVSDAKGSALLFQVIDVVWYDSRPGRETRTIRELKLLIKASIPALGYTTIYFDPAPGKLQVPESRSGAGTIDTATAILALSPQGIDSIVHKQSGKTFTSVGNVIYNEIKDEGPYHYGSVIKTLSLSNGSIENIQDGELCSSFRISGNLGTHHVVYDCIYYPHNSRLSFRTTIRNEGGSGHFMAVAGLPDAGVLHSDVHFGVEERDVSEIKYGSGERLRQNVFWGSHWTNWSKDNSGVTLIATTGEKGFEYLSERNRLGHYLLMSIPRETKTWERFVTQAREGVGQHVFDYKFIFHEGDIKEVNVVRESMEAMHPIMTVSPNWMLPQSERNMPLDSSFLSISPATVQLSAFYQESGKAILRVYESSGKKGHAIIGFSVIVQQVREVNFNGLPIERIIRKSGKTIEFDIQPWEIVTVEVS